MTHSKAKVIFATHMEAARKRSLTTYEKNQLSTARQVLRQQRKPVSNARKRISAKRNPGSPVLIYGRVTRIEATKTQPHICDAECKAHGHRYFHDFKTSPKMWGMPDGSLRIK